MSAPAHTENITAIRSISHRENDFLQLACIELTYNEILAKMFLGSKTIKGYRSSLFEQLCVRSQAGWHCMQ